MRVIIFGSSSEVAKAIIPLYSDQEIISINRDHSIFNKDSFFVKDDFFCEGDVIIYISSILYSLQVLIASNLESISSTHHSQHLT